MIQSRAASGIRARAAGLLRRLAWHWVLIVAVSLVAGLTFAGVGEDVFQHETGAVDQAVRAWMLAHRTPAVYEVFLWITRVGSPRRCRSPARSRCSCSQAHL